MRVESLREQVLEANLELVRRGLVLYTFGNASGISRQEGVIAIKPSGAPYEQLTVEQIVVTDLAGSVAEGNLRPSSDPPTHVELYPTASLRTLRRRTTTIKPNCTAAAKSSNSGSRHNKSENTQNPSGATVVALAGTFDCGRPAGSKHLFGKTDLELSPLSL
jgi:L-ribulose-5-phosphate 4-epimerase